VLRNRWDASYCDWHWTQLTVVIIKIGLSLPFNMMMILSVEETASASSIAYMKEID
jgi:hypothetical protein